MLKEDITKWQKECRKIHQSGDAARVSAWLMNEHGVKIPASLINNFIEGARPISQHAHLVYQGYCRIGKKRADELRETRIAEADYIAAVEAADAVLEPNTTSFIPNTVSHAF